MTKPVPQFSAEIFPSETVAGLARLEQTVRTLHTLGPDFVSVTYGAGGSTRGASQVALDRLRAAGIAAVPHLSALGASRQDMRSQLDTCRDAGVRRLVVLRGDAPSGLRAHGEFTFATDLVRFIREETAGRFHIDVAAYPECHPQARSADADLAHFKAKFDAGANSAITQYFFNADAYADFLERCTAAGIHAPIVPGVMPIGRFARLVQFTEARGIEVPRWIRRRMKPSATTMPRSAPSASRWWCGCANGCWRWARPACTSSASTTAIVSPKSGARWGCPPGWAPVRPPR